MLSNGHSWLSGVLLLVVTSSLSLTLAACSQSNTSGSDSQPVKVEQSATQNAQVQNESSAPTNAPVTARHHYSKTSQPRFIKMPTAAAVKNG